MTPSEFKFWFDGFTEAFSGCPTTAQWARIKERIAEIDGNAVTERVYLDRYWSTYPAVYPYYSRSGISGVSTCMDSVVGMNASSNQVDTGDAFNSWLAMGELGRAEAKSLAA